MLALNGDCFLRLVRTRYCSLLSAVVHNCICQLKPQGWNFQLILLVPLAFLKVSLSFNLLSRKLNYKPLFKDKIKLKFKLICHDFHYIRLLSMHPSHVVLERPHFHGTFSGSFLTFSLPEVASFDKIPDFIF